MPDNKDLGEPIDVNSLPTDDLLANTIYKNSENADTPFIMKNDIKGSKKVNNNYNPTNQRQVNLTIEDTDDIKNEFENTHEKSKVKKPISNKKATTQLKKFRELFGIKRIDIKYHTITRKDTSGNEITMVFGFRALNYEDYQWLIEKTASIEDFNLENVEKTPMIDMSKYRLALIAISLCTLDNEPITENKQGTPIWQIFGIEPNNEDYIKDPYFPHTSIRHEAAELMLQEIKTTLFDIVSELFDAYSELIDNDLGNNFISKEGDEETPLKSKNSND